jgi:hypothetical protein
VIEPDRQQLTDVCRQTSSRAQEISDVVGRLATLAQDLQTTAETTRAEVTVAK